MAKWKRLPKELIVILLLLAIWLAVKLYENIVIVLLIFIWIVIFICIWIYFNGFSLNSNKYYWIENTPSKFSKILSIINIVILTISFINISSHTEYYKKQFQEWLQNWFTSIAKWIFALRKPWKFIIREAKKDMRENLSWSWSWEIE